MATNKPVGDNARKGAVRKRTQLRSKTMGEGTWTKRDKNTGKWIGRRRRRRRSSRAPVSRRRRGDRQGTDDCGKVRCEPRVRH